VKFAKSLKTVSLVLLALLLFLTVTVVLLLRHKPNFYAMAFSMPTAEVDENFHHISQMNSQLINVILNSDPTYTYRVSDAQVNAWFRRVLEVQYKHRLPDGVSGLCVRFRANRIIVGMLVDQGPLTTILQLFLEPQPDGPTLRLRLVRARAGALPVPLSIVRSFLRGANESESSMFRFDPETDTLETVFNPRATVDSVSVEHSTLTIKGKIKPEDE
jgi:hypothetical protein